MDIEMLRELIPLLADAGEGAFWLLLLVIGKGYLAIGVTGAVIAGIAVLLFRAVRTTTRSYQALCAIKQIVLNKRQYGEFYGSECDEIIRAVTDLKEGR